MRKNKNLGARLPSMKVATLNALETEMSKAMGDTA